MSIGAMVGATHERVIAFDCAIESTVDALSDGYVQSQLGSLATELLVITNNLYLPNVRANGIYMPRDKLLGDGFALLPQISSDPDTMFLDGSMLTPTRNQAAKSVKGHTESGIDERIASDTLDQLIGMAWNMGPALGLKPRGLLNATTHTAVVSHPRIPTCSYRHTPFLHISDSRIGAHPSALAGTVAHEDVHGKISEARSGKDAEASAWQTASEEIIAYHVGAVIRAAGGVLHHDGRNTSAKAELLRLKHTTPDDPFAVTDEYVNELNELISAKYD